MKDKPKPEEWTKEDESDLLSTEAILEYAWKSFQAKKESFDKLDSKAATLAGFIGIIMALSAGLFRTDIFNPKQETIEFIILAISIKCFYSLLIMILAVSFGYCLATLKVRKIVQPTGTEDMIKYYRNLGSFIKRKPKLLKGMINIIGEAENSFRENNLSKSEYLKIAENWLI